MSISTAKTKITNVFKTNGSAGITGANSQSALTGMIDDIYADKLDVIANPSSGNLVMQNASGGLDKVAISATSVSGHLASTSNPHSVTKSQVGLGNCDNTSDADKPISTATQTALDAKATTTALTAHTSDTDNPHSVTKAQLGLGNVDNTSDANKPVSTATQTALDDKADIDGEYPLLQAGSAINIAGSDEVDAEINFRTSGGSADIGSGTAKIAKIEGNSYPWNQLLQNSNNLSLSLDNTSGTAVAYGVLLASGVTYPTDGHKVYGCVIILSNSGDLDAIESIYINDNLQSNLTNGVIFTATKGTGGNAINVRVAAGKNANFTAYCVLYDLTLIFGSGNEPSTLSALKATQIGAYITSGYHAYDAGSLLSCKATGVKTIGFNQWDEEWELGGINTTTGQPETHSSRIRSKNYIRVFGDIAYLFPTYEYYALFYDANYNIITPTSGTLSANGVYLYNQAYTTPPTAVYMKFTALHLTTYNNDICINISHSGYRNGEYEAHWNSTTLLPITTATGKLNGTGSSVVVFSDGMKSAGSVRDEAWNETINGVLTGKARKRLGIVDLGTLNWRTDWWTESGRLYCTFSEKAAGWANIIYPLGPTITGGDNNLINVIGICGNQSNSFVYIGDAKTHASAQAFIDSLSGVYAIYELATPLEYTMDSAWAQGYRVDDFGTEQIVPAQSTTPTSAPLYLEVEYALNVKDAVRNLPKNYVSCTDTDNTLSRIESALSSVYGITMTHTWDSTNTRYTIAMSGGWQPVSSAPASATASGTKGQYYIATDALYVCVASNTWRKVALTTW